MAPFDKEIDITRNIKMIELLKSQLLSDVASLFKSLINGVREEMHDSITEILSNIILVTYLLGKRLGINYHAIEIKIRNKVKLGLVENHEAEKYYSDLSELSKHFDLSREQKKI